MIELGKYLIVYFSSSFRFFLGPTLGIANNLGVLTSALLTIAGMMTTVYLISYLGTYIRAGWEYMFPPKKGKIFTPRKRRFVRIWRSYGMKGLAFATPIILSPVIGVIVSNLLERNRSKIIKWMWLSALFWAFLESFVLQYASNLFFGLV